MVSLFITLRRFWRSIRRSATDPEFRALLVIFAILLLSGTVFYRNVEGWSTLDAMYFSIVAITTVGFGDFSPETSVGKVLTMVYLLVGIGVTVSLVAKIATAQVSNAPSLHPGHRPPPRDAGADTTTSRPTRHS